MGFCRRCGTWAEASACPLCGGTDLDAAAGNAPTEPAPDQADPFDHIFRDSAQSSEAAPADPGWVVDDRPTIVSESRAAWQHQQWSAPQGEAAPPYATPPASGVPAASAPPDRSNPTLMTVLVIGVVALLVGLGLGVLPRLLAPTPSVTPPPVSVQPSVAPTEAEPSTEVQPTDAASAEAPSAGPSAEPTPSGKPLHQPKSGTYYAVLESMPKSEATAEQAWALAGQLSGGTGRTVAVADSDLVGSMNAGYWVVGVPDLPSRAAATAVCQDFGRPVGGECYPREVN